MEMFFGWVICSLIIGAIGSGRRIGFGGAFAVSLFFSPIIGLICAIASPTKEALEALELLRAQEERALANENKD